MSASVVFIVIVVLIIAFIFGIIGIYNTLIVLKNEVENAWSQIDNQLKRRHDLIPNIVETVKGYAAHEKEAFEKVIKARQTAVDLKNATPEAISQAENQLSGALKSLFALSENYPELKANQNFSELQEELRNTDNKISYSRQFYNDSVTRYNTKLELFPSSIIAGMFNFESEELFKVENEEAKNNVKVNFSKSDSGE